MRKRGGTLYGRVERAAEGRVRTWQEVGARCIYRGRVWRGGGRAW